LFRAADRRTATELHSASFLQSSLAQVLIQSVRRGHRQAVAPASSSVLHKVLHKVLQTACRILWILFVAFFLPQVRTWVVQWSREAHSRRQATATQQLEGHESNELERRLPGEVSRPAKCLLPVWGERCPPVEQPTRSASVQAVTTQRVRRDTVHHAQSPLW